MPIIEVTDDRGIDYLIQTSNIQYIDVAPETGASRIWMSSAPALYVSEPLAELKRRIDFAEFTAPLICMSAGVT